MTTIVYRDGIMAADSRGYSGGSEPIGSKAKVFRLNDGSLVGVSSTEPGVSEVLVDWLNSDASSEALSVLPKQKWSALLVRPNEDVFYFCDSPCPSGPLRAPFYAIGSGAAYAMGAFSCGSTSAKAVSVASEHDVWTGGEIIELYLHNKG